MRNEKKSPLRKLLFIALALFMACPLGAKNITVVLDACEEVGEAPNQWRGVLGDGSLIYVNSTDQKEGAGCLETTGGAGADKFAKAFADPIDITAGGELDLTTATLKFWLYISDPSLLNSSGGQLELGSAGRPDVEEWSWPITKAMLLPGWNEYSFPISSHSGGEAANVNAINWFRLYKHTTADDEATRALVYRIDNIRIEGTAKPEVQIQNYRVLLAGNQVNISWEATKELNLDHYLIERSVNGFDFSELAQVAPQGTAELYNYADTNPLAGPNYYRLSAVTTDDETLSLGLSYVSFGGADNRTIIGKVIAGYQGWFNCYGDGSAVERWAHWSAGKYKSNEGLPAKGHLSFEIYPEITEYDESSLYQTAFEPFSDGRPAKLFSSYKEDVIDKHFEWMQQYGIDGVALQRFLGETKDGVFKRNRDSIAVRMKRSAEKYERIFYIMYDMSADDTTYFKSDWEHMERDLKITDSPAYAYQDGKPVICIWGFGLNSRSNAPEKSQAILNWLKGKGYYIIGGVPTNFRTGTSDSHPGYEEVYKSFDMLSPWTVGRYGNTGGIDSYKNNYLIPDYAYCQANGIAYQPVMFSGFAWSNWNSNKVNEMPRNRGEFLWRQLYNIRDVGIPNAYIAMFDEYDEGTAILPAADSYFSIPTDQYFLTYSADGTYISSDFYMRLAGKATKALKGIDPLTPNVTIPFSEGPIWFRTSVEKGFDATFTSNSTLENAQNVESMRINPVQNEQSHIGTYAVKYTGKITPAVKAQADVSAFDVDIPITANTKLGYWRYPLDENGRNVFVNLLLTDGTRLSDHWAYPNNLRRLSSDEINTWSATQLEIGNLLAGKTIDKIYISYNISFTVPTEAVDFSGYIDDIVITDTDEAIIGSEVAIPEVNVSRVQDAVKIAPTFVREGVINVNTLDVTDKAPLKLQLLNMQGAVVFTKNIQPGIVQPVFVGNVSGGIYVVSITGNQVKTNKKIIIE